MHVKIIMISLSLFYTSMNIAQGFNSSFDFEKAWKEVEEFMDKGLPKSALNKVEVIHQMSLELNERAQVIRSSVYIARLLIETEEDGIEKAITRIEKVIDLQGPPTNRIMSAYLAELYNNYLNRHRYVISQRSEIENYAEEEYRLWTTSKFLKTIESLYIFALESPDSLDFDIKDYSVILNSFDEESIVQRPTLYEWVADRAISFFQNSVHLYPQDLTTDVKNTEALFSKADSFIDLKWEAPLPESANYKVLKIYQNIIKREKEKNASEALAYYDLARLSFVYNMSPPHTRDKWYQQALEQLALSCDSLSFHTEIIAVLATHLLQSADTNDDFLYILEQCDIAIQKYPGSTGADKCRNIQNQIKRPEIQAYIEKVYPTDHHILWAVDYKNLQSFEYSIVQLDRQYDEYLRRSDAQEWQNYLMSLLPRVKGIKKTEEDTHYTLRKVEYIEKPLPYGTYAILMKGVDSLYFFQYIVFQVSDLAYTSYQINDQYVLNIDDRTTGKPINRAQVIVSENTYNADKRKREWIDKKIYYSDKKGRVQFPMSKNRHVRISVRKDQDVLDADNQFVYYRNSENRIQRFAEIFTDRSLYRPGQIVFFKAILMESSEKRVPSILKNHHCKIFLKDANGLEISQLPLKTNSFGSISGSFTIPSGILNGTFTLELTGDEGVSGFQYIHVEEYKRPTFEIETFPVEEGYSILQEISFKGQAKTLAGSPVDGAQVKFKVTRQARFPFWAQWWRLPLPSSEVVIGYGVTDTNDEGFFNINFIAEPDPSVDPENLPVFTYSVEVDITDQRGETRSTQSFVSVGYHRWELDLNVPVKYDKSAHKPWVVTSKNLQGSPVHSTGQIKIFKLREPVPIYITKYWEGQIHIPLNTRDKEMYIPHYPDNGVQNFDQWEIESEVHQGIWTSGDSMSVNLNAGVYKVEVQALDSLNRDVQLVKYVVVTDLRKNKLTRDRFLHIHYPDTTLDVGDTMEILMAATDPRVYAHVLILQENKIIWDQKYKVCHTEKISIPIEEYMRGGFSVSITYTIKNRVFVERQRISVPWSNKSLNIRYETFRDKTLPGSQEEYSVVIEGPDKDRQAAEMLVSMYDASLDQFRAHHWKYQFYPEYFNGLYIHTPGFGMNGSLILIQMPLHSVPVKSWRIPRLIPLSDDAYMYDMEYRSIRRDISDMKMAMMSESSDMSENIGILPRNDAQVTGIDSSGKIPDNFNDVKTFDIPVKVRKNLNETVFFMPQLKTDEKGRIKFSFTMNEALTRWKMMSFAHTQNLSTGYDERSVQTQKEMMIFPNAPRFVRDGDKLTLTAKVSNMSDKDQEVVVSLVLTDPILMKDVSDTLVSSPLIIHGFIPKGSSETFSWQVEIPERQLNVITYRMSVSSDTHSDTEENMWPVLTDRMLITETLPIWINGHETRLFHFNSFKNNLSTSKNDHKYIFEYTAHPMWYAIQAMPYIHDQPGLTSMSLAERFFTHSLAQKIILTHPKIKAVFGVWGQKDKGAFMSHLRKNEDLKSAILEETPWVQQAISEEEQKRNIALLLDIAHMSGQISSHLEKLKARQLSNGGFPWLSSGRDNVFVTQNILENIGHLHYLGALDMSNVLVDEMIRSALSYVDNAIFEKFEKLKKDHKNTGFRLDDNHLDELSVMYLYVRSFFNHIQPDKKSLEAIDYYLHQCEVYGMKRSLSEQAMIGLVFIRNHNSRAQDIYLSLKEKAVKNEDMGWYWNAGNGYAWYQLPIETHALILEFFMEMEAPEDEVNALKLWLLKNKQTTHWNTPKASVSAIYALLIQGKNKGVSPWIVESVEPVIWVGKELVNTSIRDTESGTGYVRKVWTSDDIPKDMSFIKITNNNSSMAWGAAYYQYFEQLQKVKSFEDNPLTIKKSIFKVDSGYQGDRLWPIDENTLIKVGDKLNIQLIVQSDRNMEYIHMKDLRPAGTEPDDILSGFRYREGLNYYHVTKDVSSHFYFDYLPKGTYIFEYTLRVTHPGDFTTGLATIGSMYAPEFTSHSEGGRISIQK